MEIEEIFDEIGKLPKETLVYKNIKGKKQPYLQWSEGGKTKSRYIKVSERAELIRQLERKEELKELLKKKTGEFSDDCSDAYYISEPEISYDCSHHILNEQLISKKDNTGVYSVERNYINSKKYHDIFLKLPFNHEVQERLYKEAGRLLEYVDGDCVEHMIALSARTGVVIVDNFSRTGYYSRTSFTDEEYKSIVEFEDSIILLHNHSSNGRPSMRDIISYATDDKVKLSLVLCHDGTVYAICYANKLVKDIYESLLEKEKERWNDNELARIYATNNIFRLNDKLGNNHKLFEIRRY